MDGTNMQQMFLNTASNNSVLELNCRVPHITPPKIPYRICPIPSAIIWRSRRTRRRWRTQIPFRVFILFRFPRYPTTDSQKTNSSRIWNNVKWVGPSQQIFLRTSLDDTFLILSNFLYFRFTCHTHMINIWHSILGCLCLHFSDCGKNLVV